VLQLIQAESKYGTFKLGRKVVKSNWFEGSSTKEGENTPGNSSREANSRAEGEFRERSVDENRNSCRQYGDERQLLLSGARLSKSRRVNAAVSRDLTSLFCLAQ